MVCDLNVRKGRGYFVNPKGYEDQWDHTELVLGFIPKAIREFKLKPEPDTLTFVLAYDNPFGLPAGTEVRPDNRYFTDGGSIPLPLQPIIQKDIYSPAYYYHDSAYSHHGLWFRMPGESEFSFRKVSMFEANDFLELQMYVMGAWLVTLKTVHYTLDGAGWFAWKGGRDAWNDPKRAKRAGTQQLPKRKLIALEAPELQVWGRDDE